MNIFLIGSAGETMAAVGAFGALGAIFLGALYVLCPLIIMSQLRGLKLRMDKFESNQRKSMKEQIDELQRQNALTRQLLRAYGHEPEA